MDEGIRARLGLPAAGGDTTARDLRRFGFGLAALLCVLAALSRRKGGAAAPWELALAALAALLAGLRPLALRRLYGPWMKIAGAVGKANTYAIMALFYYLVLTPYGIAIRCLGYDLLDERLRDRESYWRRKEPLGPESYRNQF